MLLECIAKLPCRLCYVITILSQCDNMLVSCPLQLYSQCGLFTEAGPMQKAEYGPGSEAVHVQCKYRPSMYEIVVAIF